MEASRRKHFCNGDLSLVAGNQTSNQTSCASQGPMLTGYSDMCQEINELSPKCDNGFEEFYDGFVMNLLLPNKDDLPTLVCIWVVSHQIWLLG
jgi:hypothetical protein